MIITICGPAKFVSLWDIWNQALTFEGHLVFSNPTYALNNSENLPTNEFFLIDKGAKQRFDATHMAKIAASQAILVLNAGGYIGDTTRLEVVAAISGHKQIYAIDYRKLFSEGGSRPDNELVVYDAFNLISLPHAKICKKVQQQIVTS